jgi:hypothetical protein
MYFDKVRNPSFFPSLFVFLSCFLHRGSMDDHFDVNRLVLDANRLVLDANCFEISCHAGEALPHVQTTLTLTHSHTRERVCTAYVKRMWCAWKYD